MTLDELNNLNKDNVQSTPIVDPMEKVNSHAPAPESGQNKSGKLVSILIAVLAVAVIGGGVWIAMLSSQKSAIEAEKQARETEVANLQLSNEELRLANQYQEIQMQYAQYENQMQVVANDSLNLKYQAAKQNVEKLLTELNSEKKKSAAQIKKLEDEIATLKGIMRHYVEQIDALNKENESLKAENADIKSQNENLSTQVENYSRQNTAMQERINLAEKLNVTGIDLTGLKKNGKQEKNITKAKQLKVTFTIPKNNSTPVGVKHIYLRITTPEGDLLGNGGNFKFEGSTLASTAHKDVEYQGEEIPGVTIYYDVTTTLNPGQYRVELFADNYRLGSRTFTMKK